LFIICAAIISGVGLGRDDVVAVVASMLVSPLMGPILGMTFGCVSLYEAWKMKRATSTRHKQIVQQMDRYAMNTTASTENTTANAKSTAKGTATEGDGAATLNQQGDGNGAIGQYIPREACQAH